MKLFPALDIPASDDLVLAALDDFAPTAVEEREAGARVFFATSAERDAARDELAARNLESAGVEVSDQDWAARSQQHLPPITVGGVTIVAGLQARGLGLAHPESLIPNPLTIVIEPSMGFGTGHHATTRLCLAALQKTDPTRAFVLDVGTGSGILAIAAARLGAARAHGIDFDADAVESAERNLALNPEARNVTIALADLASGPLPSADIVVANLTGATLVRFAGPLVGATREAGTLIVSGVLATEENEVREAFRIDVVERTEEGEWVCLRMKKA